MKKNCFSKEHFSFTNLLYIYRFNSTVLRQDSSNTEAIFIRGKALYYAGNFEHAINHYSQALRLDPDFSKARDELKKVRSLERKKKEGNDAFSSGSYETAVQLYTEALEIDPDNTSFNSQLYANRAAAKMKVSCC